MPNKPDTNRFRLFSNHSNKAIKKALKLADKAERHSADYFTKNIEKTIKLALKQASVPLFQRTEISAIHSNGAEPRHFRRQIVR